MLGSIRLEYGPRVSRIVGSPSDLILFLDLAAEALLVKIHGDYCSIEQELCPSKRDVQEQRLKDLNKIRKELTLKCKK